MLFKVETSFELMGVAGMLLFIPLCSVAYALFRDHVKSKLALKQVSPEKWKDPE